MRMWVWLALTAMSAGSAAAQSVEKVDAAHIAGTTPLPTAITGRVQPDGVASGSPIYQRQWPGTYVETRFEGKTVLFEVGPGDVHLRITIDAAPAISLMKPAPGLYRISGLAAGAHHVRIDVVSENQGAPTTFGGFHADGDTRPLAIAPRRRQIEFIGDSHTVGYGNTSPRRECTPDEVWATTDTSRGIAPLLAARYGADYQVNAISGRGIVRNYAGGVGDPLPVVYPFTLFDKAGRHEDPDWTPDLIVISLGTNDFSTALGPEEKWKTREDLHADFQMTYLAFVQGLRARHPKASFILWATDMADGEIASQVRNVADRLRAAGEKRIGFVAVNGLEMTGCNYHPSLADDVRIAAALSAYADAHVFTTLSARK